MLMSQLVLQFLQECLTNIFLVLQSQLLDYRSAMLTEK